MTVPRNLHRLDPADQRRALDGLERVAADDGEPTDFRPWIDRAFGKGLAELFMVPYNEKVWGYPLETLGTGLIADRVAVPDLERVRHNLERGEDEVSWGPNRRLLAQRPLPGAGRAPASADALLELGELFGGAGERSRKRAKCSFESWNGTNTGLST